LENIEYVIVDGGEQLITTLGLEDIVIVDTKDTVMDAHKDNVQDVNKIVKKIKDDERSEFKLHREVYRSWGSGSARREFLHVEDMALGALFVLVLDRKIYESNTKPMISHINVGSNIEICIADLARLISDVTGYQGQILFDSSKSDGAPRKLMSSAYQ